MHIDQKEEIKQSLSADDMIIYTENAKESLKKRRRKKKKKLLRQ